MVQWCPFYLLHSLSKYGFFWIAILLKKTIQWKACTFPFSGLAKMSYLSTSLGLLHQDVCYAHRLTTSPCWSPLAHSWTSMHLLEQQNLQVTRLPHSGNITLILPFAELLCPSLVIGHPEQMYPERSSLPHRSKLFWATFLFNILLDAES